MPMIKKVVIKCNILFNFPRKVISDGDKNTETEETTKKGQMAQLNCKNF